MSVYRPSALQEEQRHRALRAMAAAGLGPDRAKSAMWTALKHAPRSQRASTTFRLLAERYEGKSK